MDNQAVAKRFAENLQAARAASGLTIDALAARSEIHRSQVSEILGARADARLTTILRLAGALKVDPSELIEGLAFEPADRIGEFKVKPAKES